MNYTIKPMERKIEKEYLFESLCEDLKKLQAENENLRKALEQEPKTGWVFVSERLPKENGWYQCTTILNDSPQTMELYFKNGKWLDNRRIDMFNKYDIYGYGNTIEKHKLSYQELISEFDWTENVIAWQPLPKSYKAENKTKQGLAYADQDTLMSAT